MGELRTQTIQPRLRSAVGRDNAIDFTRGVCIISMIFAHIAGGSTLYAISHALVWVDGSMGFVFLAGVVLGMVRRRTTGRFGIKATALKTLARTRLIYIIHVLVTLLALAVGTSSVHNGSVSADTYGWPASILRTLVLALNPPLTILGLWVVLLLVGVGALALLGSGRMWMMLAISFAAYGAGKLVPFSTGLPGQDSDGAFQLGAWQFLFCLGLAIGWAWRGESVQRFVSGKVALAAAAAMVVSCTVLAHLTIRVHAFDGFIETLFLGAFNKLDLGAGAIVFALAVALLIYRVAAWAGRTRIAPALRPISTLGSYSLDSYVISTVAAIVFPAALSYDETGRIAEVLAVAVVGACLAWAYGRGAYKNRAVTARSGSTRQQ